MPASLAGSSGATPVGKLSFQDRVAQAARSGMHQHIDQLAVQTGRAPRRPARRSPRLPAPRRSDCRRRSCQASASNAVDGKPGLATRARRYRHPTGLRARADVRPSCRAAACARRRRAETAPCRSQYRRPRIADAPRSASIAQPTGPYLPGCRSGMAATAFTPGRLATLLQLPCCVALDPGSGRIESVDRRAAIHVMGIAHDGTFEKGTRIAITTWATQV